MTFVDVLAHPDILRRRAAGNVPAEIQPSAAFYSSDLKEFVLPYAALQQAIDPDAMLLAFLQSTYEAAADLAHWDRAALESTAQ